MRVISGKYKSRLLDGFKLNKTRATMDRVKEIIFALIGDKVRDKTVIDLFSGTGSLGIEALSNGAKFCYFNDSDQEAKKIIEKNLNNLAITNYHLGRLDYKKALEYYEKEEVSCDILILDPPYKDHIIEEILVLAEKILHDESLIVCETEKSYELNLANYLVFKERIISDKKITILRKR